MSGKTWFIRWFWLFNKKSKNYIWREICKRTRCPSIVTLALLLFVLTALWWLFSTRWINHLEDTKSIVMNHFMYTFKFYNSPCGEISTSPTQRCALQTGSHTSHDSMFRWSKCFKEARTKTVLSSHCTYYMFLHIQNR